MSCETSTGDLEVHVFWCPSPVNTLAKDDSFGVVLYIVD